ncbi:YncE family protein [Ostreibacterium oceani]|uniref:Uncharacterized protein n=1 Tax=Ostreibacterium oceani TaxID=2654998 RepID=A0A6N7ETC8_9GAMM|nr:hypothetical protein [Ostreibacterium oceani]MPV85811.1 hypothetical protein [Ostreibacterium oceani]
MQDYRYYALGLLVLGLFGLAFYAQKTWLPTQLREVQASLNLPTRYAFIADLDAPQLAVYDTYEDKLTEIIALKAPAQLISVSRIGGVLAYGERNRRVIYVLDLSSRQQQAIDLENGVTALSMHSGGRWIAYSTANAVVIYDRNQQSRQRIAISGEVGLTYSADGQYLFVAEMAQGIVHQVRLNQATSRSFSVNQPISAVSVSPITQAVYFTSDTHLYRYDSHGNDGDDGSDGGDEQALNQLPISAQRHRPYLSSDGRNLFVFDSMADSMGQSIGQSIAWVDPHTLVVKQRIPFTQTATQSPAQTPERINEMHTGWLAQVLVMNVGNQLISVDFVNAPDRIQQTPLGAPIHRAIVLADSKTYLATIPDAQMLLRFDLRTQTLQPMMALPLERPGAIVMGETNTLCH